MKYMCLCVYICNFVDVIDPFVFHCFLVLMQARDICQQFIAVCSSTQLNSHKAYMQFAFMNIQVHIEDHIVKFVGSDDISSLGGGYVNSPKFKIMATHLGITTLYVSS